MDEEINNNQEDQQIHSKHWFGFVSVLMLSIVLACGVVYYLMNQQFKDEKSNLNAQIESERQVKETCEREKEELKEEKHNSQLWDNQRNIKYQNYDMGIEFTYKVNPDKERDTFLSQKDNEFTAGRGFLKIFTKSKVEKIENAIMRVAVENGADPSKCSVDSYIDTATQKPIYYVKYNKEFEGAIDQGSPERIERVEETLKACSNFSIVFGPGGKDFIYHPEESETEFAYIQGNGIEAPFINEDSIKFIKD